MPVDGPSLRGGVVTARCLIADGLAVQEHRCPRFTTGVDAVVPDVLASGGFLTADVVGAFRRVPGRADRLEAIVSD